MLHCYLKLLAVRYSWSQNGNHAVGQPITKQMVAEQQRQEYLLGRANFIIGKVTLVKSRYVRKTCTEIGRVRGDSDEGIAIRVTGDPFGTVFNLLRTRGRKSYRNCFQTQDITSSPRILYNSYSIYTKNFVHFKT